VIAVVSALCAGFEPQARRLKGSVPGILFKLEFILFLGFYFQLRNLAGRVRPSSHMQLPGHGKIPTHCPLA
jgi:hypothetical protein